jgi:hypothetical protein
MRSVLSKAALSIALTAVAALGADNTLGTWKLNVARSKLASNPFPLKALTVVREASGDGAKVTSTGNGLMAPRSTPATRPSTMARNLQ